MPEGDLSLVNSLKGIGDTASFKLNRQRVRIQILVNQFLHTGHQPIHTFLDQ